MNKRTPQPIMRIHRVKPEVNPVFGRRKKTPEKNFTFYVQLHERSWGHDTYPDKPTLEEIMNSRAVLFWKPEGREERYQITCHEDEKEVEKILTSILFKTVIEMPKRRIARVFINQKRVIPRAVRILFEEVKE